jgi:vitamin B12/bleomycin/antimicrobial peptide transport system ATP-binding/permease protein
VSFAAHTFKIDRLTLKTPNSERTLFSNLSFELGVAQSLLVVGASGCGKSSLLRAIAGLWRNGKGEILAPDWQQVLFLPQQSYLVLGSLREQALYPHLRQDLADSEIASALAIVNLKDLPARMGGFDRDAFSRRATAVSLCPNFARASPICHPR